MLFCLAVLTCKPVWAQETYYGSMERPSVDTPELYRIMWRPYSDEMLPSIDAFNAKEYLRVTNLNQILDIWRTEDDSIHGMVVSWIDECTNREQTDRSFISTHLLSATTTSIILRFADSLKLTNVPSNYPLPDSVIMNDGFVYNINYAKEGNHISKQHVQSSGQYGKQNGADTLIERMFILAEADNFLKPLLDKTPFQCSCWGIVGTCKPFFTKPWKLFYSEKRQINRQKKAYSQERGNYHKKLLKKDPAIFLN
jgi:hypothetical protein